MIVLIRAAPEGVTAMSFKVETPQENPFTAIGETLKSMFWIGLFCGVFLVLGLYTVTHWEGWKSEPRRLPPMEVESPANPPAPPSQPATLKIAKIPIVPNPPAGAPAGAVKK